MQALRSYLKLTYEYKLHILPNTKVSAAKADLRTKIMQTRWNNENKAGNKYSTNSHKRTTIFRGQAGKGSKTTVI